MRREELLSDNSSINQLHLWIAMKVSCKQLSLEPHALACVLVLLLRDVISSCQKSNEAVGGKEHIWEFLQCGNCSSFTPSAATDYLDQYK